MKTLLIGCDMKLVTAISSELGEAQHELHYAAHGDVGLRIALKKRFDLIVLDWSLPKKGGLDVLIKLRKLGKRIPIMMLVGEDSVRDVILSLDSGANTCVTKPFVVQVLIARMNAVIRRSTWNRNANNRRVSTRAPSTKEITQAAILC